MGNSVEYIS